MSGACVLGRGHVRLDLFGFGTCIWPRLEYLESTVAPPPLVYDIHTYSTLLEMAYRHAHGYTLVLRPEHAGYDMVIRWHARLGVVSAMGSPMQVSADFAFPGAFAGWAGGVENGPRGGRCYYCGRLRQSAPSRLRCRARIYHGTEQHCSSSISSGPRPRVRRRWNACWMTVRCCGRRGCTSANVVLLGRHLQRHLTQEQRQQFARGAREGHISRNLPPLDGLV